MGRPRPWGVFTWSPDSRSLLILAGPGGDRREVWRAFVDGTPAVKLDAMVDANVSAARLHPGGRLIAFQVDASRAPSEFWVTENLLPPTAAK
jgi:hypothetical protein